MLQFNETSEDYRSILVLPDSFEVKVFKMLRGGEELYFEQTQFRNLINDYLPMVMVFIFRGFELPLTNIPNRPDLECLGLWYNEAFVDIYDEGYIELVVLYEELSSVNETLCEMVEHAIKLLPVQEFKFED